MSLNEVLTLTQLQWNIIALGTAFLLLFLSLDFVIQRFRNSLSTNQIVSLKIGSDTVHLCKIMKLNDDGINVVLQDLVDGRVRFSTRNEIFFSDSSISFNQDYNTQVLAENTSV